MLLNLWATWIGILAGMLAGAGIGVAVDRHDWLGGYASWARRMVRLGHVSFFGLAFVNLAFFLTVERLSVPPSPGLRASSWLLVAGAALMPAICFLSGWRPSVRRLFALPVACVVLGVIFLLASGVVS